MPAIDEFNQLLQAYRNTFAWAVGSSALMPLIASFGGLAPIWPPAVTLVTSLYSLFMIIISFQIIRSFSKKKVSKYLIAFLVGTTLFLFLYLYAFERFTFVIPTNEERIYLGCGWSELAKTQSEKYLFNVESGCPGAYERILPSIQYEAKIIWNKESITNIKTMMFFVWLGFFSCSALLVSSFLAYQQKRSE